MNRERCVSGKFTLEQMMNINGTLLLDFQQQTLDLRHLGLRWPKCTLDGFTPELQRNFCTSIKLYYTQSHFKLKIILTSLYVIHALTHKHTHSHTLTHSRTITHTHAHTHTLTHNTHSHARTLAHTHTH